MAATEQISTTNFDEEYLKLNEITQDELKEHDEDSSEPWYVIK